PLCCVRRGDYRLERLGGPGRPGGPQRRCGHGDRGVLRRRGCTGPARCGIRAGPEACRRTRPGAAPGLSESVPWSRRGRGSPPQVLVGCPKPAPGLRCAQALRLRRLEAMTQTTPSSPSACLSPKAVFLASATVLAALALTGCSALGIESTYDKSSSHDFATGAEGKEKKVVPSWVPD